MDLVRFSWRRSSSGLLLLLLWARPSGGGGGLQGGAVVFEARDLECEKHARKRGFIHASDDAVMPMPGSTVDQIDIPVF